jgi:hypothetical protein
MAKKNRTMMRFLCERNANASIFDAKAMRAFILFYYYLSLSLLNLLSL